MASKVEQQYKLLNAELMDHVQKQRIEIGAYKKQLIALKRENMDLREAQILQNARQRQDHIGVIRSIMRRLDIDADCLADRTLTAEKELESSSFVVSRRSQQRRSSKDICQEMRRSSSLACSTKTFSPTRRRILEKVSNEAPESAPSLTHTPPPRRAAELANDGSSDEEQESTIPNEEQEQESTTPVAEEEQPTEEGVQRQSDERLFSIIEDSDWEFSLSSSSSSSPIICDSTLEENTPPRRALCSVDPNVVPVAAAAKITRGKSKPTKSLGVDKDNSTEEQSSIQLPRLVLTRPSQSPVQSLFSSVSLGDANKSSPRPSLFDGDFRMSGTNTSTPIRNKTSTQQRKNTTEKGDSSASTSRRYHPNLRARKLVSEPRASDQQTDLSTSCLSSSGRPSRKCRPTQLSEPSLRDKMRNNSVGTKK